MIEIQGTYASLTGRCTASAGDNALSIKQSHVLSTNTDDGDSFLRFIMKQPIIAGRSSRQAQNTVRRHRQQRGALVFCITKFTAFLQFLRCHKPLSLACSGLLGLTLLLLVLSFMLC